MHHTMLKRALAALGTTLLSALVLASPAAADGDAPAGNNGHIKIDDVAMDDGNENVPHPGCTFVVDFFGYDVGTRTATLTFEGQAPTGGGELLVDTWTFEVTSRETGNELNASRTVDLSSALAGIEPHPLQGWHVKLTVHVDGARGADVKHKVFWVSECAELPAAAPAAAPAIEVPVAGETAEVLSAEQTAAAEAAAVESWLAAMWANAVRANAAAAAAQQASLAAAGGVAAPAGAAGELPRTGALTHQLVGVAILLLVGGRLLVRSSQRSLASGAA
ncbi:MAG TPA: hypothetical protein VFU93_00855 [Acidimicrobiales bacterium]|nr:hypothetical protein [Acidimicrobiales bacterium]